jgi:hypothetical protein
MTARSRGITMATALPLLAALLLALGACAGGAAVNTIPPPTALPNLPSPMAEPNDSFIPETQAPELPDPEAAYQQLLAEIPPALRASCTPETYSESFPRDPGELAGADCDPDGSGPLFVNYSLFVGKAEMDAAYELLKRGFAATGTISGPGCGKGPGEGTWDLGRKLCYQFSLLNDAKVLWTHDLLAVLSDASDDGGDWARLESFWKAAGPLTP